MLNVDIENGVSSPVLKHGPRSQTDAQERRYSLSVLLSYLTGARKSVWCAHNTNAQHRPAPLWVEIECACLDPKGGELCLNKVKPGETQVEACSDADVQIARMI